MFLRLLIGVLLLLVPQASFGDEIVRSPLKTRIDFASNEPVDGEPVIALLAHEVDTGCGWLPPDLVGVTRTGQTLRIDIAGTTVFGGLRDGARSDSTGGPKCTPPNIFLVAQEVDLGPLTEGTYQVEVYLTDTGAQPEPTTILTNRRTLEVLPARGFIRLQDAGFTATVEWTDGQGGFGYGLLSPGATDDSAVFTFFDRQNWELMVKVLDGCAINGHYWVFAAAATDVGYTLKLDEVASSEVRTYTNPAGTRSPAVADIEAFPCSIASAAGHADADPGALASKVHKDPDTITPSPLRTSVRFTPEAPTADSSIVLLMAHELNTCGWFSPSASFTRSGSSLRIDLEASPGFGGGLAVDRPTKCSPPAPYLEAQRLELGRLDPGIYDVEIYLTEILTDDPKTILTHRLSLEVGEGTDIVSLQDERFSVAAVVVDSERQSRNARPVLGATDDSTLFTFFDDANWELMVKVLDGCAINDHYWVFTAGATNAEYQLGVRDETTGETWFFDNPSGVRSPAVADTLAFPCSATP